MIPRIAGLIVLALMQWQSLSAAQVNYSNLLPQNAAVNFVKTDASGNIYVAGTVQAAFPSLFLAKISADGTKLIYNTSIAEGGPGFSFPVNFLAVSPDGFAYVSSMSVTQPSAPCCFGTITKLDPSGNILLSIPFSAEQTFLYSILDMTTDTAGNLYATGILGSNSAPQVTDNSQASGFTNKLDSGLNILWSAPYGGYHIAVDTNGNAYVVGTSTVAIPTTPNAFQSSLANLNEPNFPACGTVASTAGISNSPCPHQYVTAIDKSGSKLIYSTFLSGTYQDVPAGIAVDAQGNAYVAGSTHSFDFPTTPGVVEPSFSAQAPNAQFPGFINTSILSGSGEISVTTPVSATGYVAELNPSGTGLVFSTFLGGSASDLITGISLDPVNPQIDLGGSATSPDFPGIDGAYRQCVPQGFVARLSLDGTSAKRTVLIPTSVYMPTVFTPAAANTAFFASNSGTGTIDFEAPDSPIACLANSSDLSITNTVAPGQLLTIFGNQLGPQSQAVASLNNFFPAQANGVQVTVGGVPAPLLYVSPGQINLQVPFEVAPNIAADLQLASANSENFPISDSRSLTVIGRNPTIFQIPLASDDYCLGNYPDQSKALILNADGTLNGCSNPAKLNTTVTIFMDGLGTTVAAPGVTGMLNPSNGPAVPITVTFTGNNPSNNQRTVSAVPLAGSISGLYQVAIPLPVSATNGLVQATLDLNAQETISVPAVP